jgi:hypothetical protein
MGADMLAQAFASTAGVLAEVETPVTAETGVAPRRGLRQYRHN